MTPDLEVSVCFLSQRKFTGKLHDGAWGRFKLRKLASRTSSELQHLYVRLDFVTRETTGLWLSAI